MCKQCQTNPVYEFTNKRKICKTCFVRWFEKKFLYTIRRFELIKKLPKICAPQSQQTAEYHANFSAAQTSNFCLFNLKSQQTKGNLSKLKIKKGEIISYKKSKNFRDIVLESLLKMYSKKGTIKLVKSSSENSKFASSSTADIEAKKITETIIKKNIFDLRKENKKIINPLILFLDKEVLLYAKLKKFKFTKQKNSSNKICEFIDELEKKHPEIKQAIVQTILKTT